MLLGNGDGTFQPGVDYPAATPQTPAVVADLDRDGYPDVVLIDFRGVAVLRGRCLR